MNKNILPLDKQGTFELISLFFALCIFIVCLIEVYKNCFIGVSCSLW